MAIVIQGDAVETQILRDPGQLMESFRVQLHQLRVETVPIAALVLSDSPRLAGVNNEHVQVLTETEATLPPIIVHRPSMRVIDGMHRVRAAQLRGRAEIQARLLGDSAGDLFLLAVQVNSDHGLPLSLADRKAAALRIVNSYPQWSDRTIAHITGLSDKTVSAIRRGSNEESVWVGTRIGKDGRVRPVNAEEGRERVAELIKTNPDASLRELARLSGISPETVRKVREQLRHDSSTASGEQRRSDKQALRIDHHGRNAVKERVVPQDLTTETVMRKIYRLQRDPSLRLTEAGRVLLRLLHFNMISPADRERLVESIPEHSIGTVTEIAHACAYAWQEFAAQLESKEITK